MSEECLSDLPVIAMHYGERVSADEVLFKHIQEEFLTLHCFNNNYQINIVGICILSWVWLVTCKH